MMTKDEIEAEIRMRKSTVARCREVIENMTLCKADQGLIDSMKHRQVEEAREIERLYSLS